MRSAAERRGITDGGRNNKSTTLFTLLNSDQYLIQPSTRANFNHNTTMPVTMEESSSTSCISGETTPYYDFMSPLTSQAASPYVGSPWTTNTIFNLPLPKSNVGPSALVGSLVREEGHVYSLATSGDLLYTGSESKNIRVWKRHQQLSCFKCTSGFVKAIVVVGDRIFTGHQDGKIRVWRTKKGSSNHKRVGTLPKLRDYISSSFNPSNYVKDRLNRNVVWIKHFDAVSCLTLSEDREILYSGSWDRTVKVWRVSDFKCLDSINAHDDAVNSVVTGFGGLVFSGSADGTLKVWRRDMISTAGRELRIRHIAVDTLLKQDRGVTSLAVNSTASVLYCGSSDGMVNYWEVEKQLSHGGVLRGHKLAVLCLATSGSLVFSGSTDKTICVWRRSDGDNDRKTTHSCLSVLTGHLGPVKCLAVDDQKSEDENTLVLYSGSLDRSVKVWKVPEMGYHHRHCMMSPF